MAQAAPDHRLARELAHFERHYEQESAAGIEPLSDSDKRRYADPPADTVYAREFFYHLMKPRPSKRVLEIACGNGLDASLMAHNGAEVCAYDLSPQAVQITQRRARVNGVSDRVRAEVCGDLDQAYAGERFEAIAGYAALHHMPLEGLASRLYERLEPGGVAVFAEPVINSRFLNALRRCVPLRPDEPTEDERPLNDRIIAEVARPFDRVVQRHFQCVSRVWPYFARYPRVVAALHRLDGRLMRCAPLRRFASVIVFGLYRDR